MSVTVDACSLPIEDGIELIGGFARGNSGEVVHASSSAVPPSTRRGHKKPKESELARRLSGATSVLGIFHLPGGGGTLRPQRDSNPR